MHELPEMLDVTPDEVRRIVAWLTDTHVTRRPRQRKRRAITYSQRDQIASLVMRLAHHLHTTTEDTTMHVITNREDWIKQLIRVLNQESIDTDAEGADFDVTATEEAGYMAALHGEDVAGWPRPEDVALTLASGWAPTTPAEGYPVEAPEPGDVADPDTTPADPTSEDPQPED